MTAPARTTRWAFPADVHAPARARHTASQWLTTQLRGHSAALVEDVELIVSELVTNAVQSSATSVELTLTYAAGGVHVSVTDDGVGRPQAQEPEPTDLGGRGLRIVDTLAARWGVLAPDDSRTTLWSVLMRLD